MASDGALGAAPAEPVSTRRTLAFVYAAYAFRYLYLLILVPFYGRVLGASEYGRVLAAMSLFQMVWILTEYGLPIAGLRDVASSRDPAQIASLYGRHMAGRVVLMGPGMVLGVVGTLVSPVLRETPIFGVLATLNGLVAASNLGWLFQGTLRFRTSLLLELSALAINLPMILLLVHGPEDAWLVPLLQLISSSVSTVAAHVVVLRTLERSALQWRGSIALLRSTTALFAHRGLGMIMSSSSTYFVSLLADAQQVGWYGAAERLVSVGLAVLQPANQVFTGTVASRIGAQETEGAAYALMRKGLLALTGVGVIMSIGTIALGGIAVPLILGPEFGPSVPMLRVLGLIFPFAAFCQVMTGYVLIPLRMDSAVARTSLFCAMLTLVLMFAVGWPFQAMGVAWVRSFSYVLMAAALLEIVRRREILSRIFPSLAR